MIATYFWDIFYKEVSENDFKMPWLFVCNCPFSVLRSSRGGFMHSEAITKELRFRPSVRTMTCHPCTHTSEKVMGSGAFPDDHNDPALSSHAYSEIWVPLYLWSIISLRLGLQLYRWAGELKLCSATDLVLSDGEKEGSNKPSLWIME